MTLSVRATEQDEALTTPAFTGNSGAVMMQVASEVNVRKEADTKSESLGLLSEGTMVFVTGTQGEWRQILYQGQSGYIREDFLVPYGSDKQQLAEELETATQKGQEEHQKLLEEEEALRQEEESAALETEAERAAREEAEREAELEKQRVLQEAERLAEENRNKTRRNMGLIISGAAALIAGYAAVQIYREKHPAGRKDEEELDDEDDDWDDEIEDLSGEE